MKTETLYNGEKLDKIGFGTWKIGGGSYADRSQDARSLKALSSALELGYTHFDTAEMYAGGHAEELLGQAIRETGIPREDLFITSKVVPYNLGHDQVLRSCEGSLRRLGLETLDLYLIHWPSSTIPLEESFSALNRLVSEGKVRHLGVSNFRLPQLRKAQELCETPLATNQVPYSLSDRTYVENGMLEYCRKNNILLTAYSPVDEGRLRVNSTLQAIARTHHATPYQIALAWLVQQPGVITIPMSSNPKHQAENLAAAEIELTSTELAKLD